MRIEKYWWILWREYFAIGMLWEEFEEMLPYIHCEDLPVVVR